MNGSHSTLTRTVVKTLSYRALSLALDCIVIYILTQNWSVALTFGGVMLVISTVVYFAHDRAWTHIHWGKIPGNGNGD